VPAWFGRPDCSEVDEGILTNPVSLADTLGILAHETEGISMVTRQLESD